MNWFNRMASSSLVALAFSGNLLAISEPCCPLPPCDPCCDFVDNFSLDAAFLYWKLSGDDYAVAVTREGSATVVDGVVSQPWKDKVHRIKGKWGPGFRVGAGFDIPCLGWGMDIDWTHFSISNSKKASAVAPVSPDFAALSEALIDSTSVNSGSNLPEGASSVLKGHLKFKYDTVDLEMGKWICCGSSALLFKPHVGLRFADVDEKVKTNRENFGLEAPNTQERHIRINNRFRGAGLRAGLDTNLYLSEGWSFIGRAAASLVWGTAEYKYNYSTVLVPGSLNFPGVPSARIKDTYHTDRFFTDLSLGIRWKSVVCDCYPVEAELAWEHHFLFDQHKFLIEDQLTGNAATQSYTNSGNVTLQGLTLRVGIDF